MLKMTIPEYTAWANVPATLKTKTQLKGMGLKPARDQAPAARFCSYIRGKRRPQFYNLYDLAAAVPVQPASEAQIAHLAAGRAKSLALRTCRCGRVASTNEFKRFAGYGLVDDGGRYLCRYCQDHDRAAIWARGVLHDPNAIILDSETTGLEYYDQIIELAVIEARTGRTLINTLIQPADPKPVLSDWTVYLRGEREVSIILPGAFNAHGLTLDDLAGAPTWPRVWPGLSRLIRDASRVIIYNAAYDTRLIEQTNRLWGLPDFFHLYPPEGPRRQNRYQCAMEEYAQWVGEWSDYHRSYKWQPLHGGHRALGDCQACLEVIRGMAREERSA